MCLQNIVYIILTTEDSDDLFKGNRIFEGTDLKEKKKIEYEILASIA